MPSSMSFFWRAAETTPRKKYPCTNEQKKLLKDLDWDFCLGEFNTNDLIKSAALECFKTKREGKEVDALREYVNKHHLF